MADGAKFGIPFSERSAEEARELGSIGGKKSVKVRREKKAISQLASAMIYS